MQFVVVPDYETVASFPKPLKDAIGREKFIMISVYSQIEKLNAPVTMRGYDNVGNVVAQASVPGATDSQYPNRIAITADPGNTRRIKYVVLTGNNGGGALNVKNLQMFMWN